MFFPNLVAFTSESETCKMKRCMQGDIEIHDGMKGKNWGGKEGEIITNTVYDLETN